MGELPPGGRPTAGPALSSDPAPGAAERGTGRSDHHPPDGEALSDREVEVLRLLATNLTGPEIADRLFMSVNTFRTHTRHIFTKLDVNTRRAAVSRAPTGPALTRACSHEAATNHQPGRIAHVMWGHQPGS